MVKIRTLNEISQLYNSDFNQPPPRTGLDLLYWFAQKYRELKPTTGAFGFHRFYNRIDDDDDELLPNQDCLYYEVGNLKAPRADKLPDYVRKDDRSNMDRIIVRLNDGWIDRVYVTEHVDQKNFSHTCTYRVSLGLLNQISRMGREQFLKRMEKPQVKLQSNVYYNNQSARASDQQSDESWCTIL
ncbi:uncharacterized protein Hap1MRO34_002785 [Clarias gariepinus]